MTDDNEQTDNKGLTEHPWEVEDGDHYETNEEAWVDVSVIFDILADMIGKNRRDLHIWDPFYCEGSAKKFLNSLGYQNVTHEAKDFYKVVQSGLAPNYDILATNPPYSKNHKTKTLEYAVKMRKPWAFLIPNYVCANPRYQELLSERPPHDRPFFLAPASDLLKYEFKHRDPAHSSRVQNQSSPFRSYWFIDFPGWNQLFMSKIKTALARITKPRVEVLTEAGAFVRRSIPIDTMSLVANVGFFNKGRVQRDAVIKELKARQMKRRKTGPAPVPQMTQFAGWTQRQQLCLQEAPEYSAHVDTSPEERDALQHQEQSWAKVHVRNTGKDYHAWLLPPPQAASLSGAPPPAEYPPPLGPPGFVAPGPPGYEVPPGYGVPSQAAADTSFWQSWAQEEVSVPDQQRPAWACAMCSWHIDANDPSTQRCYCDVQGAQHESWNPLKRQRQYY